jgi:signal transduction histidine kinase
MDFAQSGVTNSIPVEMMDAVNVSDVVSQVVEEMRTIHPDRSITSVSVAAEAKCDPVRLGQLLSNLLGNAIKHGAEEGEVRLVSTVDEGNVTFTVTNSGKAIPKEQISSLFRPFVRGKDAHETKGLGLGLYICSQIAKAHRGSLGVSSTDAATCFTFRLPLT